MSEDDLEPILETLSTLFTLREVLAYDGTDLHQKLFSPQADDAVRQLFAGAKNARVHAVASIGESRARLPEWQKFRDLTFEVQVITAMEDIWAEISHQLDYKAVVLKPASTADIVRNFNDRLEEFIALLAQPDVHEKRDIHTFLDDNQFILHPNPAEIFSEVPLGLGTEFRMDFQIREATGSYLLVELENSRHRLFTKSGDFSAQVNHAQRQVEDWQQWIDENLYLVQKRYPDIVAPIGMVVIGRSVDLSEEEKTRLARRNTNQRGRMVIHTYDDLIQNARQFISSIRNAIT